MKEIHFLQQNADKWKRFDALIRAPGKSSPDQVAELFIELTDDLSYARTFYPASPVTAYLNGLTAKFHQAIFRNKKEERRRLRTFWTQEQPVLFRRHWKEMLMSLVIFVLSVLIGIVSSANDDGFVRLILGDSYIAMTVDNIEKGDPMAVYKSMNNVNMFLGVTVNNIRVALLAFASGVILSFGAGYIIFFNGIMIGAFHYFFFQKGLLTVSLKSIWIHGALEMTAVIIAGGAGIVIGNGILFPGTYTRADSFKRGAKDGLKIVIGVVPLFCMAGLLEGFVTRHTDMAPVLSVLIIGASLAFVIWYYILYPICHHNKERFHGLERKI